MLAQLSGKPKNLHVTNHVLSLLVKNPEIKIATTNAMHCTQPTEMHHA